MIQANYELRFTTNSEENITKNKVQPSDIRIEGASFEKNCGAASVGVLQDNLVLSTGLIM